MTRRTGRPTRAEAVEIDRRIQTVAVESFISNGFDGTSMEAVAASAGVTRRTLYAKYRDKEALFVAAVPLALATSLSGISLEVPDGSLEEVLRSLARQIIARLVEPPATMATNRSLAPRRSSGATSPSSGWTASTSAMARMLSK